MELHLSGEMELVRLEMSDPNLFCIHFPLAVRRYGEEVVVLLSHGHGFLAEDILAIEGVAAVILPARNLRLATRFAGRVGWIDWTHQEIRLPENSGKIIIGLFRRPVIALSVLRKLRASGVSHIGHYSQKNGTITRQSVLTTMSGRVAMEALRLGVNATARYSPLRVPRPAGSSGLEIGFSDEDLWGLFLERSRFHLRGSRLPSVSFDAGHVMIVTGSLGAGGSERQVSYTARGLSKLIPKLTLAVQNFGSGGDFFLSTIQSASINVVVVPAFPGAENLHPLIAPFAIEALEHLGGKDLFIQEFATFFDFFVRQKPGVVHCWLDWPNCTAGLAAFYAGVPRIVLSCRSLSPTHFTFLQPFMRPVYRNLLKSERVVMLNNSQAGAADYAEWLGSDRQRTRLDRSCRPDSK